MIEKLFKNVKDLKKIKIKINPRGAPYQAFSLQYGNVFLQSSFQELVFYMTAWSEVGGN